MPTFYPKTGGSYHAPHDEDVAPAPAAPEAPEPDAPAIPEQDTEYAEED